MKLSFIILYVVLSTSNSFTQTYLYNDLNKKTKVKNYQEVDMKALHFGFAIGFNTLDFSVKHSVQDTLNADIIKLQPGFHVNIITDFRLAENLSVRFLPGLIFGQRNMIYYKNNETFDADMKIESNLLDFPLLLKYKSKRIENYRPYIIGGGSFRVDMAAKKKFDEDEEVYLRLKKFDYYYEFGLGIDFYSMYFKFSTELKLSVGLRDILEHTPEENHPQYVNVIERMNSSIIMFSMHFE